MQKALRGGPGAGLFLWSGTECAYCAWATRSISARHRPMSSSSRSLRAESALRVARAAFHAEMAAERAVKRLPKSAVAVVGRAMLRSAMGQTPFCRLVFRGAEVSPSLIWHFGGRPFAHKLVFLHNPYAICAWLIYWAISC